LVADIPESVKRWTAKRRMASVVGILKEETSVAGELTSARAAFENGRDVQTSRSWRREGREYRLLSIEGFGIVFLEAAAAGSPIVDGRSVGVEDAGSNNVNGLLVQPANVEEVAGRPGVFLSNSDVRSSIGKGGRIWSRRFDSAERIPDSELPFGFQEDLPTD
jgi:hypothetical protein